jgi:release factor glutamine methyltransferase
VTRVAEALRNAAQRLAEVSDTARLDAELLLATAMRTSRSRLLIDLMNADAPSCFSEMVERRMSSEPIAYILGEQEFYGRTFAVNRAVLIPRADSETTVDAALAGHPDPRRILDCGTGSGALLLTLLAKRPLATGVGIDISPRALDVAKANAGALGLSHRASLLELDWTRPESTRGLGRFDLIVANPPYVETGAELAASVREHEPSIALFAGPEGLEAYRALIPQLPALLADHGVAVLEIGHRQAETVTELAQSAGFAATLHRDLADRPRALSLRIGGLKKALGKPGDPHYLAIKPAGG